ncbi:MAG: hypothetical protein LBQ98_03440 [Nitrososphaerota archaeon]|nr:hypothetical protein [Nitrososphaerota archaeon]
MPPVILIQTDTTKTPEPTITPTPKPEPTAKPTMDFSCQSIAADSFKFEISGTLSYNNSAIPNAQIYIRSSADNGDNWENFALAQTNKDGTFNTLWLPKTTGTYLLCAHWNGNDTLRWMNTTLSLAVTSDANSNTFATTSTSKITTLKYDPTTQTLSFNTNGTQTAIINTYIPKTLVSDAKTLQIKIDRQTAEFTSKAQDNLWLITCPVNQGIHSLTLQIPPQEIIDPNTIPWLTILIAIILLIVIVVIVITIRRRRKTAATVAAILKQNRP